MKWIYLLTLSMMLIMTGCQFNAGSTLKATPVPTPISNPIPNLLSTTPKDDALDLTQLIGNYPNQLDQVSLYKSKDGLFVKRSSDNGKTWSDAASLPIKQDWEKEIQAKNVYVSLLSSSSPSWILITSDPALGLMNKSLYSSNDNGKTWTFINDVSQVVDGYVTGISFCSPTDGWITASQHGTAMLPLYRTKDGGKTWSLQNIPITKGYKYGNAFPPKFDVNNLQSGTLKIEFVRDSNKDVFEFTTKDGGETWVNIGVNETAATKEDENAVHDVIAAYFKAIENKDYSTAWEMISSEMKKGYTKNDAIQKHFGVKSLKLISIQTYLRPQEPKENKPTIHFVVKLDIVNKDGAWDKGINERFVRVVKDQGQWKISALATSP
jgi:hypothetical protein